ncbi:MAG: hypothetical protein K2P67_07120 [Gallionellaceae bacterium]|nr:hypothetical protein [Gallionellaceae bacterium]
MSTFERRLEKLEQQIHPKNMVYPANIQDYTEEQLQERMLDEYGISLADMTIEQLEEFIALEERKLTALEKSMIDRLGGRPLTPDECRTINDSLDRVTAAIARGYGRETLSTEDQLTFDINAKLEASMLISPNGEL